MTPQLAVEIAVSSEFALFKKMLLYAGLLAAGFAVASYNSKEDRVELSNRLFSSVYLESASSDIDVSVMDFPLMSAVLTCSDPALPRNQYSKTSKKSISPKNRQRFSHKQNYSQKKGLAYQPWQLKKMKQLGVSVPSGECFMYQISVDLDDDRKVIPADEILRIVRFDMNGMITHFYKGEGIHSWFPKIGCIPLDTEYPMADPQISEEQAKALEFREQYGDSL